jgi:acetyl esterase/lipase
MLIMSIHQDFASLARALFVAGAAIMVMEPGLAANSREPETAASAVLEDHYPQQRSSYPNGVTSLGNLTFSTLDGFRPLTLDLYLPKGKPEASVGRPLVIYVHGGGWSGGHSRNSGAFVDFPSVLASLAAKGYVVSSINYRLSREAPFPAAIQDVKAAVRWLRVHATEYGIDKSRVMIWGGSAGGQLAALAATSCNVAALEPAAASTATTAPESTCVQGAVLWYPVVDFETMLKSQASQTDTAAQNPTSRYLGCTKSSCLTSALETVRLASPLSLVNANTPPVLLIHGVEDRVVPVAQSQAFHDKMKTSGAKTEILLIPVVDHSFIGKTPEATHAASIQALNRTFEFIDATLGKPVR